MHVKKCNFTSIRRSVFVLSLLERERNGDNVDVTKYLFFN